MDILVTGANGQLGREFRKIRNRFSGVCDFTDVDELDLTDRKSLENYLEKQPFRYIINCAAYTNVDGAESDRERAMELNRDIPANLKEQLNRNSGLRLIHISTDFVFDGTMNRPLNEEDPARPLGTYGISKLEGEQVLKGHPGVMIIRTSWLYSVFGNNFVKSMIRRMEQGTDLRIVYDQVGTPTYAEDLAMAIMQIISDIERQKSSFIPGVYHYSNEGIASWYDLAVEICRQIGCGSVISPIRTHEYPLPAKRPAYSVLDKSKIKDLYQVKVPHWRDSLERCIRDMI